MFVFHFIGAFMVATFMCEPTFSYTMDSYNHNFRDDTECFERYRAVTKMPIEMKRKPVDSYYLKPFPCQRNSFPFKQRSCGLRRLQTPNTKLYYPSTEVFPYPPKYDSPNPTNTYYRAY